MNNDIKPIFVSVVIGLFAGLMNYIGLRKLFSFNKSHGLFYQNLKNEFQSCYTILDPDLQGLLLSPRARFTRNGEYLCCSQCFKSLTNDKLNKNPPKFAIAKNLQLECYHHHYQTH